MVNINNVEFLFRCHGKCEIIDSFEGTYIKIWHHNNIFCYQGWDLLTYELNAFKRKTFTIPASQYVNAANNFNASSDKTSYNPALVIKTEHGEISIVTVTDFHILPYSEENPEETIVLKIKQNYPSLDDSKHLKVFRNQLINNSDMFNNAKKADFIFSEFKFKYLNFNKYLTYNNIPYPLKDQIYEDNEVSRRADLANIRGINFINLNYIFQEMGTLHKTSDGFKITLNKKNIRSLVKYQGWNEHSHLVNSYQHRYLEAMTPTEFSLLISESKDFFKSINYSVEKFGFEPTTLIDVSLDGSNHINHYAGVLKSFNFTTSHDNSNFFKTSTILEIEISLDQINPFESKPQELNRMLDNKMCNFTMFIDDSLMSANTDWSGSMINLNESSSSQGSNTSSQSQSGSGGLVPTNTISNEPPDIEEPKDDCHWEAWMIANPKSTARDRGNAISSGEYKNTPCLNKDTDTDTSGDDAVDDAKAKKAVKDFCNSHKALDTDGKDSFDFCGDGSVVKQNLCSSCKNQKAADEVGAKPSKKIVWGDPDFLLSQVNGFVAFGVIGGVTGGVYKGGKAAFNKLKARMAARASTMDAATVELRSARSDIVAELQSGEKFQKYESMKQKVDLAKKGARSTARLNNPEITEEGLLEVEAAAQQEALAEFQIEEGFSPESVIEDAVNEVQGKMNDIKGRVYDTEELTKTQLVKLKEGDDALNKSLTTTKDNLESLSTKSGEASQAAIDAEMTAERSAGILEEGASLEETIFALEDLAVDAAVI